LAEARPDGARPARFGTYELDPRAGELRKAGVKVRLQEQPLQILTLLLERPGEIVTRQEIRSKLWPDGIFVDFDHGLNAAVKRLREALGDSAENPRFVETIPRRGYRFLAPVHTPGADTIAPVAPPVPARRRNWVRGAVGVLLLAVLPLALNVGGVRGRLFPSAGPPGEIESIAVLPLKNLSGDPEQDYFVAGMHEALTTELSKISALKVISRSSSVRYRDTAKPLKQIARELG
jgi:DNA-binding winged helix-turn-helix (wHTH) protein